MNIPNLKRLISSFRLKASGCKLSHQCGFTLYEVLIAIAITGILAAGIALALGTSIKTVIKADNEEKAKDLAISEMEYIRSQTYADSYTLPAPPAMYSGYTVTPNYTFLETGEQKIEIEIYFNGNPKPLFTLTDYRANY